MSTIKRFRYVAGAEKKKHILMGELGTPTVCGAWYFGKETGRYYPPYQKPVCKHCERRVG